MVNILSCEAARTNFSNTKGERGELDWLKNSHDSGTAFRVSQATLCSPTMSEHGHTSFYWLFVTQVSNQSGEFTYIDC